MTDDISRVAQAVEIGRRTLRIALQSIWIGIALSVVLMGIAAFGATPPPSRSSGGLGRARLDAAPRNESVLANTAGCTWHPISSSIEAPTDFGSAGS